MKMDVLTVSSKGQIVLPFTIRNKMSIEIGTKLAVYATDDVIMLKPIHMPSEEEFTRQLDTARDWAQSVGYKESDVNRIIKNTRRKKKSLDA